MAKETEAQRNLPSDEGRDNDPHKRGEDATQPGVNTMSTSKNDDDNQHLTRTASDEFREDGPGDEKADKRYDQ